MVDTSSSLSACSPRVTVIGGGPAGLMAATVLAGAGARVAVFDAMATLGRKFLVAGRGGLNLSRSEPAERFVSHYGVAAPLFGALLADFSPEHLRDWLQHQLRVETFVGSSGRIFPSDASAGEIIRRWRDLLSRLGVEIHPKHRWVDLPQPTRAIFTAPDGGTRLVEHDALLLGLGGASWPQTGSDGGWVEILAAHGVRCMPFRPANSGFDVAWSPYFRERFQGSPLKNITLRCGDQQAQGELTITRHGIEGGAVYQLSGIIRDHLALGSPAVVSIDLKRDLAEQRIRLLLEQRPGKLSMSTFLRKRLRLGGPAYSLLRETLSADQLADPGLLARTIKALPVPILAPRPLAEAISSAGGICLDEVNSDLMLTRLPGVFVAGEMLDWEAPTGGYLLQGAFSTGFRAGQGALRWIRHGKKAE
ncbi:MAG: NAD(P)/FAD-dependent oxidoreductase [Thermodesulfobacteriota bacterium]